MIGFVGKQEAIPILIACLLLPATTAVASSFAVEEARQLIEQQKDSEAETLLLKAIEENEQDHEAYALLARIRLRKQDHKGAIDYATRALNIDETVSSYHLWLARSYLAKAMESGMINAFRYARKGKGEYEKAVALDPANTEARFELCMYLVAAPGLVGGDREKGMEHAKIIEAQDSLLGAYAWAGVWESGKDLDKAEASLRHAVGLDTSSTYSALYNLGYFFARNEKHDAAAVVFSDILAKKPNEMNALFQLGRMYVLAETNLDEAEMCFKRYLEVEPPANAPAWAAAHWRLGMVYDLQGKTDLAVAELEKAVELEPDNKEFRQTLKMVKRKTDR